MNHTILSIRIFRILTMNENKLRRLFPNASPAFITSNSDSHSRLSSTDNKSDKGNPLGSTLQGKAESSLRFKIRFTIYAVSPADWDGWHIKELQDLLVHAGCIPSDKWSTLSGEVLSRKVKTKEEEKTVVEIYSIQE